MMIVQFPNTYLSETGWRKLRFCFDRIGLYQPDERPVPPPVQDLVDSGRLTLRFPVKEKQDELALMEKAFFQWADVQGGNMGPGAAAAYLRANPANGKPADPVLQIRNEIRRISKGGAGHPAGDPMLRCRLFLRIAQAYDRNQEAIQADLMRVKDLEASLMEALGDEAGKREQLPAPLSVDPEAPEFMPLERLAAWAPMLLRDYENGQEPLPAAFITSSRDILSAMLDAAPDIARVEGLRDFAELSRGGADGGEAAGPQPSVSEFLLQLATSPEDTPLPGRPGAVLRCSMETETAPCVLVIPKIHPVDFFRRFADSGFEPVGAGSPLRGAVRHTVIAFFP